MKETESSLHVSLGPNGQWRQLRADIEVAAAFGGACLVGQEHGRILAKARRRRC
jgi:hypothetical protein